MNSFLTTLPSLQACVCVLIDIHTHTPLIQEPHIDPQIQLARTRKESVELVQDSSRACESVTRTSLNCETMGCKSSKDVKDVDDGKGKGVYTHRHGIRVDEDREADIAARLHTEMRPSQFVMGVSTATSKLHKWSDRARKHIAEHGPLAHCDHTDASTTREDKIVLGLRLLNERLSAHMLWSEESLDDGNCQFRSVASQFFGDQDRHAEVRAAACDHIAGNRGYYEIFFEGGAEFDRFLATMRRDRTWGNELTLRAITDYFGESFGPYLGSSVSWNCHGRLISPPLGAGGWMLVLDAQE
eukprot:m.97325 g.97325  ORF g.97325 m.97325 type:complete len:299 (-) comp20518_c0_seq7:338-1234(-)